VARKVPKSVTYCLNDPLPRWIWWLLEVQESIQEENNGSKISDASCWVTEYRPQPFCLPEKT